MAWLLLLRRYCYGVAICYGAARVMAWLLLLRGYCYGVAVGFVDAQGLRLDCAVSGFKARRSGNLEFDIKFDSGFGGFDGYRI